MTRSRQALEVLVKILLDPLDLEIRHHASFMKVESYFMILASRATCVNSAAFSGRVCYDEPSVGLTALHKAT